MIENSSRATNHWPLLDFLRATAALLVLFSHTRGWYFRDTGVVEQPGFFLELFNSVTDLGNQAVIIFFVLSGFLIGGSLADSMQRGSFELVRYLIARFVRIYIVYIPALVITEGVFFFGSIVFREQQMDSGGVSQAICHLAGLQGFSCPAWNQNHPLWSLGYEWALYLFAPAIIQLIVWKASPVLRVIGGVLVCAIAATICQDPIEGMYWFIAWFLGAGSYRVLRAELVPLPVGLLGAGLIIAGMAMVLLRAASVVEIGAIIAVGTAITIACRPIVEFPLLPRFFGWAAGFSYTLYAIHLPLVWLIGTMFINIGFPRDGVPPSSLTFVEFGVTIAVCLLTAFVVSLLTERKTSQVRAALLRMCPPPMAQKASDRG
jgi:peptidoglycan/LPS O-acetylase OafA/YrhL